MLPPRDVQLPGVCSRLNDCFVYDKYLTQMIYTGRILRCFGLKRFFDARLRFVSEFSFRKQNREI